MSEAPPAADLPAGATTDKTVDATALDSHFAFGANWQRFLARIDDDRIAAAETSLRTLLGLAGQRPLAGRRFLDAGCGSGLFSLAAHRLGADVVSIDFDPQSVACTRMLQQRFAVSDAWPVDEGSVLDGDFLATLGRFDEVYSWGVLHHTGDLWAAVQTVTRSVAVGGRLTIALYNDQGRTTDRWIGVKRLYQSLPAALRTPYVAAVGAGYFGWRAAGKLLATVASPLQGRRLHPPAASTHTDRSLVEAVRSTDARGMSRWHDLVDWVGGWPLEVASPGEVVDRLRPLGFSLERQVTVGGNHGCNEFVFRRIENHHD